jgi:hypothetical protein
VLLLLVGPVAAVWGGLLAFDVRGAATARAERAKLNRDRAAAAAGDLTARWFEDWTARHYRRLGAVIGVSGLFLVASGFLEL